MPTFPKELADAADVLRRFAEEYCGPASDVIGYEEHKVFYGWLGTRKTPIEHFYWRVKLDENNADTAGTGIHAPVATLEFTQFAAAILQVFIQDNHYRLQTLRRGLNADARKANQTHDDLLRGATSTCQFIPDRALPISTDKLWYELHALLARRIITIEERFLKVGTAPAVQNR